MRRRRCCVYVTSCWGCCPCRGRTRGWPTWSCWSRGWRLEALRAGGVLKESADWTTGRQLNASRDHEAFGGAAAPDEHTASEKSDRTTSSPRAKPCTAQTPVRQGTAGLERPSCGAAARQHEELQGVSRPSQQDGKRRASSTGTRSVPANGTLTATHSGPCPVVSAANLGRADAGAKHPGRPRRRPRAQRAAPAPAGARRRSRQGNTKRNDSQGNGKPLGTGSSPLREGARGEAPSPLNMPTPGPARQKT